jgi:citronellol/citronellal dehydrogenase
MGKLEGTSVFVTGGSRGIGLAIAKRFARDGAKVAIAAKTVDPDPRLPGTIHTAAKEIEEAGGQALPVQCDIRYEDQVEAAVEKAADTFGGLDILVNNASAIFPRPTLETPMKRYDLMHEINGRGTFLTTQKALPHLLKAERPHVLTLSPPLDMRTKWFAPHAAYSAAKYLMSIYTMAWAAEFEGRVAFNALWPRTAIATAAVANVLGSEETLKGCRSPEIMADAAYLIVTQPLTFTGSFVIDDTFLAECGESDFDKYRMDPDAELLPDFFVPDEIAPPPGVKVAPLDAW